MTDYASKQVAPRPGANPAAPPGPVAVPGKRTLVQSLADAATGSGAPLPAATRRKLATSFGSDLSGVRVHTGAASAQAARDVGAKAYAVGQDIHFGAGHYNPESDAGQHLLAHEVAHTVQQRDSAPVQQHQLEVSAPHDVAEHEAEAAADAVTRGQPVSAISQKPAQIARDIDPTIPAPAGPYAPPPGPPPKLPDAPKQEAPGPAPAPDAQNAQQAPQARAGAKAGTNGMFPTNTPTVALRKWNYVVYADHVRLGNRSVDDSGSGVVIGSWPWMLNNPGDLTGDVAPRKENHKDPNSPWRQDQRVWGDPTKRGPDAGHMSNVPGSQGLDKDNAAIPGVAARGDLAIFDTRERGRNGLKDWIQKYYGSMTLAQAINTHLGPKSSQVPGVDDPVAYPKRMQDYLNDKGGGKFAANYVQTTKGSDIKEAEWDGVIDAFGYAEGFYSQRIEPAAAGKPRKVSYVENKGIIYRAAGRDPIDVDPAYKSLPRVTSMPQDTPPEILALLGVTPP